MPEVVRPLLDDPERGLDELTRVMAEYSERAIVPWWAQIRTALEADIVHRARRLTAGGAIEVFDELHPNVHWRDGTLEIDRGPTTTSTSAAAACSSFPPRSPGRRSSP